MTFDNIASRDDRGEFPVVTEARVHVVKALVGVCPSTVSVLGGTTATRSVYVSEQPVLDANVPSLAVFERTIDGAGQLLSFTTPIAGEPAIRVAAGNAYAGIQPWSCPARWPNGPATGFGLWNKGAPNTTVNVYISTHPTEGMALAVNQTQAVTEHAVLRALNILNEEYGASIKLTYVGTTTSTGYIAGAIVLKGAACSSLHDVTALASSDSNTHSPITQGQISFYNKIKLATGGCGAINWSTSEDINGTNDVVGVLEHELGHLVFNVGHPGEYADCEDFGQLSIMRPYNQFPPRHRVPKDWDMEIFQQRYGPRGQSSSLYKTFRSSPTTWLPAAAASGSTAAHVFYRMGSLPQNHPTRPMGWSYLDSPTPAIGGAATYYAGSYEGQFMDQQPIYSHLLGMSRPVALAAKSGTDELLLVYQYRINTVYMNDSDIGAVCYRRSLDGGSTWQSPQCPDGRWAYRNGLTVAYDAWSDAFLIGYVGSDIESVYVWTVPADGSSTPEHVSQFDIYPTLHQSWHAPSIACKGVSDGCLMVYESATVSGDVRWIRAGVDPTTGAFDTIGSAQDSGLPAYDTPSVVYNAYEDAFIMAVTSKSNAAYGYRLPYDGRAWSGVGDIWNDRASQISTVVLTTRTSPGANPGGAYTQAWFVKYW